ncbi:hypothetical protein [Sphingomonas bisphenolicum]|uniref:Uncharacterized protein n=1 Tax=Sphingomonas bisphenolicum TaxID=296544 RepID=A0ABM7G2U9_9SPHN|nr:hypothetical protein [Sphingomonas bisphenolicum]BBF70216.1 hypothetical protein SBA_ch1_24160 [Sphingomonas bisphenolicum]
MDPAIFAIARGLLTGLATSGIISRETVEEVCSQIELAASQVAGAEDAAELTADVRQALRIE